MWPPDDVPLSTAVHRRHQSWVDANALSLPASDDASASVPAARWTWRQVHHNRLVEITHWLNYGWPRGGTLTCYASTEFLHLFLITRSTCSASSETFVRWHPMTCFPASWPSRPQLVQWLPMQMSTLSTYYWYWCTNDNHLLRLLLLAVSGLRTA